MVFICPNEKYTLAAGEVVRIALFGSEFVKTKTLQAIRDLDFVEEVERVYNYLIRKGRDLTEIDSMDNYVYLRIMLRTYNNFKDVGNNFDSTTKILNLGSIRRLLAEKRTSYDYIIRI